MVKPNASKIKSPVNNDPKEKIKKDILAKFREMKANVYHTLPPKWLLTLYPTTLSAKEKPFLQEAINEFVAAGLAKLVNDDNLRLTQKGADTINKSKS